MKTFILRLLLLSLLFVVPTSGKAILYSFDAPCVEAMIASHKELNSMHMARATVEHANRLLHDYTKEVTDEHVAINEDLDKYTKCFDIIDIIMGSASVAFKTYNTCSEVKDKIAAYKVLIDKYYSTCLSHGNIYTSDTLIITNLTSTIGNIYKETTYIGKDIVTLTALGATAAVKGESKTQTYLDCVESISNSLENIRNIINSGYFRLWEYIMMRTGYWKAELYMARSLHEIAHDAFSTWLANASQVTIDAGEEESSEKKKNSN